jgi:hypothetical protein
MERAIALKAVNLQSAPTALNALCMRLVSNTTSSHAFSWPPPYQFFTGRKAFAFGNASPRTFRLPPREPQGASPLHEEDTLPTRRYQGAIWAVPYFCLSKIESLALPEAYEVQFAGLSDFPILHCRLRADGQLLSPLARWPCHRRS